MWENLVLRQVGATETSYFQARIDGKEIVCGSWSDRRKPRETRKTVKVKPSEEKALGKREAAENAAIALLEKTVRQKMLEGFVYVRDEPGAPGEMVFAARAPGGASAGTFDVEPGGRTMFLAAGRGDLTAAVLAIDVTTGVVARHDLKGKSRVDQLFLHAGLIDSTGQRGFYALRETLRERNLKTGKERVVASYHEGQDSQFNPFCVIPCLDAAHRRLLVATTKNKLQVIDLDGERVLATVQASTKTAECRAIAISPSGKLIAAYIASLHLIYGNDDAARDRTSEVRVWRADDGVEVARIPMSQKLGDTLDIDPSDQHILTKTEYGQIPQWHAIATGAAGPSLSFKGALARYTPDCQAWAFSPDGTLLAVATGHFRSDISLHDARTLKQIGTLPTRSPVARLVFADRGRLLFAGGGGLVAGYVVPDLAGATTAKKTSVKKPAAKPSPSTDTVAARKPAVKKTTAKRAAAKQATKRTTAKKAVTRKTARKTTAKKSARR